ncbi:hypothetical protein BGX38DRAFT_1191071, partial [Terfezia claveryi]
AILATYLPSAVNETETEPLHLLRLLAYIEGLLLFSLQAVTPNITELQDVLKWEKRRIETLEVQRRSYHVQCRITDFVPGPASSS